MNSRALTGFAINWMGINFTLLEIGKALQVYKAWYYIPNLILLAGFFAFTVLGIEYHKIDFWELIHISLGVGKGSGSRSKKDAKKTEATPNGSNGETKKGQ